MLIPLYVLMIGVPVHLSVRVLADARPLCRCLAMATLAVASVVAGWILGSQEVWARGTVVHDCAPRCGRSERDLPLPWTLCLPPVQVRSWAISLAGASPTGVVAYWVISNPFINVLRSSPGSTDSFSIPKRSASP